MNPFPTLQLFRLLSLLCIALPLNAVEPQNPVSRILRLEDLDLSHMIQGWGKPQSKKSILGKPLRICGTEFQHGVGTHSLSLFAIDLKGAALSFKAYVGVDEEIRLEIPDDKFLDKGTANFMVFVDKKLVYDSGLMKVFDKPREVNVDLKGAGRLDLIVEDGGDTMDYDHVDWADACLILDPQSKLIPESIPRQSVPTMGILTPQPPDSPRINAQGIIGAGAHRDFLYYIPIAGIRPMEICVQGLPDGLEFNRKKGTIEGVTSDTAEHIIVISAENESGKDSKTICLSIGKGLVRTPPMGWNSWNCWGTSVDEVKMKEAAEALIRTGLINHGWAYVNIDDAWQGERDQKTGRISSNGKFPDMKALADFIHERGLKFGVYTDAGPKTCAGFEGSRSHEAIDAHTYSEWDVDYVKVDWCHTEGMDPKEAYSIFGKALAKCNRDIVFSICNWGVNKPWEWGADVRGNLWRTTGDITDTWASVQHIATAQNPLHPHAKPGHWNDPDMLVIGKLGWGPEIRDTGLTPNQQYCHMSYWCLLSAPLILGCDLTQLDDFTMNLITNDEVIAVNQDILGRQGRCHLRENGIEVWMKDLSDGGKAIGIFNIKYYLSDNPYRDYTLSWASLGLSGSHHVRDLWRRKDLGVFKDSFTVSLPEHGVSLIKVTREENSMEADK